MSRPLRFLQTTWPFRLGGAVLALMRQVRRHPASALIGPTGSIRFGARTVIGARVRIDAHERGQVRTGERVWLAADVEVETGSTVLIGDGTTIQRRASINGSVRIGRDCILAPNVFISSGTHPFRSRAALTIREQEQRLGPAGLAALDRPIWIQDDCWLGVNAVVCPGVVIGKGCVVGANAVVTRDVPPYSVVAGAPARRIAERLPWDPPDEIDVSSDAARPYVLSGRPVREGGRVVSFAVTADEGLRASLRWRPQARALRLDYAAARPLKLQFDGDVHAVAAGDGVLELPIRSLGIENDSCVVLALVDASPSDELRVRRLATV